MDNYGKSWIFWVILILIVFVLLAIFVGRSNSKYYECSGIGKVVRTHIDDIQGDIDQGNKNHPVYRISDDIEDFENYEDSENHGNSEYFEEEIFSEENEEINLCPELPPAFLSEVSVGEPSGVKRTVPERICRETLEKIYKKKFSKVKPDWLKNPETGRKLELDCYNAEEGIACEYNGPQHYLWPNHFPMTKEEFLAQNRRDNFKIDACDANGVYLITVPYNVPYDLIPDYIIYYLPQNVKRRERYGIV